MRVWPFDDRTLKRFAAMVVIPIVAAFIGIAGEAITDRIPKNTYPKLHKFVVNVFALSAKAANELGASK